VLGHFATERWHVAGASDTTYVHEVLIGGESLQRGAHDVLGTLIHEAAHPIATVRAIADTSRQGRYHNTKYKTITEQLGLTVERHPVIGWSLTTLPHATAAAYASTITELDHAAPPKRARAGRHRRKQPHTGRLRLPATHPRRARDAGARRHHLRRLRPASSEASRPLRPERRGSATDILGTSPSGCRRAPATP
jgi:hypothetical protein